MNDHKNIRPYQCHLCDKSYRNSFDCQQHVRKTHGINTSHGNSIPPTEPPNAAQAAQAAAAAAAAEKFHRPAEYPTLGDHWSKFS